MNKRLILMLPLIVIVVMAGCVQQAEISVVGPIPEPEIIEEIPATIESVSDFEESNFCQRYLCELNSSWALSSGGTNYMYTNNIIPTVSVEVSVKVGRATHIGLMFFNRKQLTESDLQVSYDLLESVDSTADLAEAKIYLLENVENDVPRFETVPTMIFGTYILSAEHYKSMGLHSVSLNR